MEDAGQALLCWWRGQARYFTHKGGGLGNPLANMGGGGRWGTACQGSWGVPQGTPSCYVWSVFRGLWVPALRPRAFVRGLGALEQGCSSQPPPWRTLWREACGEKHVAEQHMAASNSSSRSIRTHPTPHPFHPPSHTQNTHTQAHSHLFTLSPSFQS